MHLGLGRKPWLAVAAAAFLATSGSAVTAQEQTEFSDLTTMYLRGQPIHPAYEGWRQNSDGSYELYFGYFNINWQEELDLPIGPDNYFAFTEPGELDDLSRRAFDPSTADQGQPSHFYPRRNPFLFTVRVPEGFDQELVWTVIANGEIRRAYGSLNMSYAIDPQVISTETGGAYGSLADELRTNIPPTLAVEGEMRRTVRVGEPLSLVAQADDPDSIPQRRDRRGRAPETVEDIYANPPGGGVVSSGPGLALSWMVFRGDADQVTFDPVQQKTWMDTRVYGNSPWSPPYIVPPVPPDNRWVTQVIFSQPGDYTLRAVARDGALFTYQNVVVTVTGPAS
jgi:hypothetical protein